MSVINPRQEFQYPPQMGAYKVKVLNGAGWRKYNIARFHISVGTERFEGEKLKATMEWLSHRFDRVIGI